jgi:hypothetical protein
MDHSLVQVTFCGTRNFDHQDIVLLMLQNLIYIHVLKVIYLLNAGVFMALFFRSMQRVKMLEKIEKMI